MAGAIEGLPGLHCTPFRGREGCETWVEPGPIVVVGETPFHGPGHLEVWGAIGPLTQVPGSARRRKG